jgi:hypothetical protein
MALGLSTEGDGLVKADEAIRVAVSTATNFSEHMQSILKGSQYVMALALPVARLTVMQDVAQAADSALHQRAHLVHAVSVGCGVPGPGGYGCETGARPTPWAGSLPHKPWK